MTGLTKVAVLVLTLVSTLIMAVVDLGNIIGFLIVQIILYGQSHEVYKSKEYILCPAARKPNLWLWYLDECSETPIDTHSDVSLNLPFRYNSWSYESTISADLTVNTFPWGLIQSATLHLDVRENARTLITRDQREKTGLWNQSQK